MKAPFIFLFILISLIACDSKRSKNELTYSSDEENFNQEFENFFQKFESELIIRPSILE